MKTRNASKSSSDKVDTRMGVTKFSIPSHQSQTIKKGILSKTAKKKNVSVKLDESINNLVAQKNTSHTSLPSEEPKCKKSSCTKKQLSAFRDVIAKSFMETTKLTCGFNRLRKDFFDVSCEELARNLLGQVLVRKLENGTLLKGKIVETECYLGGVDKASQSYNGKMTERNLPMYMIPGTAYVYLTYGMYHCFNISSQGAGAAVLLRALEPLEGSDHMLTHRIAGTKRNASQDGTSLTKLKKVLQEHELCNGPAKLCTSFKIDKLSCNKRNLSEWEGMWVEKSTDKVEEREHPIVITHRIGIESAGTEWAMKPLRFYLMDSSSVSRRDKGKEEELKIVTK